MLSVELGESVCTKLLSDWSHRPWWFSNQVHTAYEAYTLSTSQRISVLHFPQISLKLFLILEHYCFNLVSWCVLQNRIAHFSQLYFPWFECLRRTWIWSGNAKCVFVFRGIISHFFSLSLYRKLLWKCFYFLAIIFSVKQVTGWTYAIRLMWESID